MEQGRPSSGYESKHSLKYNLHKVLYIYVYHDYMIYIWYTAVVSQPHEIRQYASIA